MGTTNVVFQDSEIVAKISDDGAVIEPQGRSRGFGVAMTLEEAISFAKLVLELETMLDSDK